MSGSGAQTTWTEAASVTDAAPQSMKHGIAERRFRSSLQGQEFPRKSPLRREIMHLGAERNERAGSKQDGSKRPALCQQEGRRREGGDRRPPSTRAPTPLPAERRRAAEEGSPSQSGGGKKRRLREVLNDDPASKMEAENVGGPSDDDDDL